MSIQTPSFAAADVAELVAVRRDLHQHPELGFEEVRTAGAPARPAQRAVQSHGL